MPIFFSSAPMTSPSVSRSTRKAVIPLPSSRAKIVNRSAQPPLVMYCLAPLSRNASPSSVGRAVVWMFMASDPAPGSVRA